MLYLKPLNYEDRALEYQFFRETPGENGFENHCRWLTYSYFVEAALPKLLRNAQGVDLTVGRVPETLFFLWEDGQIVGLFKVRHYLIRRCAPAPGTSATPSTRPSGAWDTAPAAWGWRWRRAGGSCRRRKRSFTSPAPKRTPPPCG